MTSLFNKLNPIAILANKKAMAKYYSEIVKSTPASVASKQQAPTERIPINQLQQPDLKPAPKTTTAPPNQTTSPSKPTSKPSAKTEIDTTLDDLRLTEQYRFIVRTDIIAPDTFYYASVHYDKFIRIIAEAGGYVFKHQIKELWKDEGGSNLIYKMIACGLLKEAKWTEFHFVYLTEAALKYLKYRDSPESYHGKPKNRLYVDKLTIPSNVVMIASALKFTLLADAIKCPNEEKINQYFIEKGIGKVGFKQNLFHNVEEFAKAKHPNWQSDAPIIQNDANWNCTTGKMDYGPDIKFKSSKVQYEELVEKLVKPSIGLFDNSKITITPIFNADKVIINLFDFGIEKTAGSYISLFQKYEKEMTIGTIKTMIINAYGISEMRMIVLKQEFESFLKGYPDKHQQKVATKKGLNAQIEYSFGEFKADKLVGDILKGKIMDSKKQSVIKDRQKQKKVVDAKISYDASNGMVSTKFVAVIDSELKTKFEKATKNKNQDAIMSKIIKQYLKSLEPPDTYIEPVPEVYQTEEYKEPEIEHIEPEVEQEVEPEEECVEPIAETPLQIHFKTLLETILRLNKEQNLNSKTADTINEIYTNPDKSFPELETIVFILRQLQSSRKFLDPEYDTLQYASDFLNKKHN